MSHFRQFLFALALTVQASCAFGEIRETNSMREALSLANSNSLVVLDLDNTLMQPVQMLGSDQFFGFLVKTAEKSGLRAPATIEWALARNSLVQPYSQVNAVEPFTPKLVRQLQAKGIRVMALTSRPPEWATATLIQVRSLGVSFAATAPAMEDKFVTGGFFNGVFFIRNGGKKGDSMLEILAALKNTPPMILFVDDKLSNVQSIENALDTTSITHVSYRYGAADKKVQSFQPSIATCQWNYFLTTQIFLSDNEAASAIAQQECDPTTLSPLN